MIEEELEAVKKRLKTLEEQVKTISAPLPTFKIKIETEPETKIRTEPGTERTRRVKATPSKIGERPVLPKQRGPPKKHQSAKPSVSITLRESPSLMQQFEQAAKPKLRSRALIGFFCWVRFVCKTPIQELRDNGHLTPGQSTRTNRPVPSTNDPNEPVPSTNADRTESMTIDNEEDHSGIDMDQLRAIMASDDSASLATINNQSYRAFSRLRQEETNLMHFQGSGTTSHA
jgi:hypothetical protein